MKNKGYIYIVILLLISLMAIFFYFIYSFVENSSYINLNRLEKINSKYMAESAINMAVAREGFQEKLEDFAFNRGSQANLNSNINLNDTEIIELMMKNKSTNKLDYLEIDAKIKYKKSLAAANLKANFVNKIYKEEDGILNSSKVESDELIKIKESFINHNFISQNTNLVELEGNFKIDYKNFKNVLLEEIEVYDEKTNNFIKEDVEIRQVNSSDIIYQKSGNLEIKKKGAVNFLIINDKVMFNDNKLFGIIVINEGAEIFNNCLLQGYLIDLYDKNSSINVENDFGYVKSYGDVLPDYIKFQPISLNHYDLEN